MILIYYSWWNILRLWNIKLFVMYLLHNNLCSIIIRKTITQSIKEEYVRPFNNLTTDFITVIDYNISTLYHGMLNECVFLFIYNDLWSHSYIYIPICSCIWLILNSINIRFTDRDLYFYIKSFKSISCILWCAILFFKSLF